MPFFEAVRLALQTIRSQKLKSVFSIIGVFIGVMFLIAVVSVVQGMNRYMTDKFAGTLLGVNTFRLRQFPDVQIGNVTDSMWRSWLRRPRVTYEDAQAVMRGVRVPVLAAWESSTRAKLVAGRREAKDVQVTAATDLYFEIRSLALEEGRAFTAQEVQAGVPVLVLGHDLADKLFEGQDAIGAEVKIFDLPYRVIGVVFVALPGLVAVSLVVGGIVIMNIMLMAVAERTREIGIRKALGARRSDILRQFLVEATTLATAGATGGVLLGIGLAGAVAALTPLPAAVAPWSILVGVVLGGGVGVVAGVYPATRAARLDPIAALRHET